MGAQIQTVNRNHEAKQKIETAIRDGVISKKDTIGRAASDKTVAAATDALRHSDYPRAPKTMERLVNALRSAAHLALGRARTLGGQGTQTPSTLAKAESSTLGEKIESVKGLLS